MNQNHNKKEIDKQLDAMKIVSIKMDGNSNVIVTIYMLEIKWSCNLNLKQETQLVQQPERMNFITGKQTMLVKTSLETVRMDE